MMILTLMFHVALCHAGLSGETNEPAARRWVDGCDWRASTFSASAQAEAAIDVDDATDEVTVVWSSRRQQDGRSGVFFQRFDREGVAIGGEQRVNVWANSHEISPDIDSANGVTWVAWQSHGRDGNGAAVMARSFHRTKNGELMGGDEVLVNQEWFGDQTSPVVSAGHDGSAMIVWTTSPGWAGLPQTHARVFDASGAPLTDEFQVSARLDRMASSPCIEFAGGARSPCVAFNGAGDGGWMVAYAKLDSDQTPSGLELCRYDLCGNPVGDEVSLLDANQKFAIEPVIAAGDGAGDESRFMVAWCAPAARGDGMYAVMAQVIDGSGSPALRAGQRLGAFEISIRDSAKRVTCNAPAIAVVKDGFVIAWNRTAGDEADIVARRFNESGEPIGDAFAIHKHVKNSQTLRAAAGTTRMETNSRGDLLCAWNGDAGFSDDTAVNVSMHATAPLAAVARGVIVTQVAHGHATRQVDSEIGGVVGANRGGAQPHEPPTFDRRLIDNSAREPARVGIDEIGFVGILNSGWTPPDPHLAVGPDHLVAIANGEIAFLSKTGTVLFQDELEGLGGFWGSLGATNFVFDPEVLFDPDAGAAGRFFAMASETISTQSKSFVLIAVSDDADPNGTWHKYRIETTALSGTTFDSPNISVDNLAVYVSGDRGGSIVAYPVYVFSKLAMMSGNPAPIVQSLLMPTSTESAGIPPVNFDSTQALYFIEHGEAVSNTTVRLIAMTNQITSPTFTSMLLDVPAYGPPEDPPQMGTTIRPETFDARFWSVAYRNGSLWATHHINSNRVIVRWYEIAMNNWPMSGKTPELVQWGEIDPGGTVRTFFSAITVDDGGNAALVFARSSPSEFISMQTAYRYVSDPSGTFQPPITRQTNVGPYTTNRWGDYAGVNVDPTDALTMWAHHEYSVNNSWRTWIQSFYPGNPCPPDIDADGDVDVDDLLAVINAWGLCIDCPADIAPPGGNLVVDVDDLLLVINSWGGCG